MQAVFLDIGSLAAEDLDLSGLYQAIPKEDWKFHTYTRPDQVMERIAEATIIVTNKTVLSAHHLEQNQQIQLIVVCATGTDNIDLNKARHLNIKVKNCKRYCTASVAQHTLGLLLALSSKQWTSIEQVRQGAWQRHQQFSMVDHRFTELSGKTLGIIGFGELGQAVARIASAMDMKVQVAKSLSGSNASDGSFETTPYGRRIELSQLFESSDFISLHCALSEKTHHLINKNTLKQMKPGAFLLNTARGNLVNEFDLKEALLTGQIAGAALDVLSTEPPPQDHVLLTANLPNLIVTPHSAWSSQQARQRLVAQVADHLSNFKRAHAIS